MLTIKALGSASDAMHYYLDQDNYYLTNKQDMEKTTQWLGKGSAKLQLKGEINPEQFLALLDGQLPNGQVLGITKNGVRKHRTGTDVTLSAPKSVSQLALVGKDNRVTQAHQKAVAATLARIEEMAAEARITLQGNVLYEKTKNLTVAAFLHTTSRALDPNLHSHLVILNMTERSDGKWRALSSRDRKDKINLNNGFREILYDNQHYLGLIYTATLAHEIRKLGFDIEITDKYGNFEIKGISKDYIKENSKRRNDILATLKSLGLNSAKAAEAANLDNRPDKALVEKEVLDKVWQGQAIKHGIDFEKIIDDSKQKGQGDVLCESLVKVSQEVVGAIDDALLHLSQFNARIRHADLVRQAFVFGAGEIEHESIEREIQHRLENKTLIGTLSESYTTESLLNQEKAFAAQLKQSKKESFSVPMQQSGIEQAILSSTDRVQIVDIKSLGVEKKLLQAMVDCNESQGINTFVLHQGRFQANQLKTQVKRDSSTLIKWFKNLFKDELVHTVSGFKYAYKKACEQTLFKNRKEVIVVHDAQKLTYEDIQTLDNLAQKSNSKLILFNNQQAREGFQAASPIQALKEAGITQHQTHFNNKKAPCDVYETPTPAQSLVNHYLALPIKARENTAIIASTLKEQGELTARIRQSLKDEGALSIQEKSMRVLSNQTLSPAQKKYAKFYTPGDVIAFNPFTREQKNYSIVDVSKQTITVVNEKNQPSKLSVSELGDAVVYKHQHLDVAIGERLVASSKVKHLNLEKGSELQVVGFSESSTTFLVNNKHLCLSDNDLKEAFLMHDYVKRPHQLTKNYDKALISSKPFQLNQANLGEIASVTKKIALFSPDKKSALSHLDKERISWSVMEIAKRVSEPVKREMHYAASVIEKDIQTLSQDLGKSQHLLDSATIANQAVSYAVAKCAEREAAFTHKDLLSQALLQALGKASAQEIHQAIEKREKAGDLIHLGTHWITKETLALEQAILTDNQKHQASLGPIVQDKNALLAMNPTLTQGQKDAVTLALTSKDRFISVQGLAGVGKTTMMREIKKFADSCGVAVFGLTPTHRARQELTDNGIPTQTIDSFLNQETPFPKETLFITDETSMIGNENYHRLQRKAIRLNARVLFAGDMTQLQAIPGGVPHELTVTTKTQKTAYMQDIMRQNPNPTLKEAAYHASRGESEKSLEKVSEIKPDDFIKRTKDCEESLNQSFVEIKPNFDKSTGSNDYSPLYDAIANDYLSRIPEHRDKTLLIAHANADRCEIDKRIRQGLQQEGVISHNEKQMTRYEPKDLTLADKQKASSYQKGDILRFDKTYSVARRGDYFTVQAIDDAKNTITCLSDDKLTFVINPAKIADKARLSLYEEKQYPVAIGDKLRLKKSDHTRNIAANTEYVLTGMTNTEMTLTNEKESVTLDLSQKKDRHWDYAYSNTAFTIQGATNCFVLSLELAKRKQATTHRAHSIDITRASHQATIYTEDKALLTQRLSDLKAQKATNKKSAFLMLKAYKERVAYESLLKAEIERQTLPPTQIKTQKTIPTPIPQNYQSGPSAKEIESMLKHEMASLCGVLLGEPNRKLSSKNNWRYGAKGSLSVNLSKGLWKNFETDEKGNCFELIKTQMGFSDFKEVIGYAKDFLNCAPEQKVIRASTFKAHQVDDEEKSHAMRSYARYLVGKSCDIQGTLAEKYLVNKRQLTQYSNADLRFLKEITTYHNDEKTKVPALIAIARDANGQVNNIEVIRLNPKTGDKDTQSNVVRQSYGDKNGCYVELNKNHKGGKTYVTEGVETGLSILEVNPTARVIAVLGKSNFANLRLSGLNKELVFCLDNDGVNTFKDEVITSALERAENAKFKTSIIMPATTNADLNDLVKSHSIQELKETLNNEKSSQVAYKMRQEAIDQAKHATNKAIDSINNKTKEDAKAMVNNVPLIEDKLPLDIDTSQLFVSKSSRDFPVMERDL